MTLEEQYFKRTQVNIDKLISFGFTKENDTYIYKDEIVEGDFNVLITIKDHHVEGKVLDAFDESEYINFRIKTLGEYASKVKEEYLLILEDIRNNCFDKVLFNFEQSFQVNNYIKKEFNINPEEIFEDSVCYRNEDGKWFAIILTVDKSKITKGNGEVEIINLKTDALTEKLLEQPGIYSCYHMNKSKWVSIILDGSLKQDTLEKLIKFSYLNTNPTQKVVGQWIVPITPNKEYYDQAFSVGDPILSKQSAKIQVGDICYLYLAKPYSSICYRCEVIENNIPYDNASSTKHLMLLKHLETYDPKMYTLDTLRAYKVNTVRSARYMPKELSQYINEE